MIRPSRLPPPSEIRLRSLRAESPPDRLPASSGRTGPVALTPLCRPPGSVACPCEKGNHPGKRYYPGRSRAGRRAERGFGSKKRIHESLPSRRRRIAVETKMHSNNCVLALLPTPVVPPPDVGVRELSGGGGPGENGRGAVPFEEPSDPAAEGGPSRTSDTPTGADSARPPENESASAVLTRPQASTAVRKRC